MLDHIETQEQIHLKSTEGRCVQSAKAPQEYSVRKMKRINPIQSTYNSSTGRNVKQGGRKSGIKKKARAKVDCSLYHSCTFYEEVAKVMVDDGYNRSLTVK